jgi:hypothetical protein
MICPISEVGLILATSTYPLVEQLTDVEQFSFLDHLAMPK